MRKNVLIIHEVLKEKSDSAVHLTESDSQFWNVDNCTDAFNILSKEHFDIIITDFEIKGISGIDLAKEVRNKFCFKKPIVLLTKDGDDFQKDIAFKSGISICVPKPGNLNHFVNILCKAL